MIKFYLVRHGETDWNAQERFQGREDIPLNEKGLLQAIECGKGLVKAGIAFDHIVASPLMRAYVTAETIAQYVHISKVTKEERLIERDFGQVSGRKKEERERMLASGEELGVEEEAIVAERMQQVLDEMIDEPHHHVLIVSHGAAIRALLRKHSEVGSDPAIKIQKNVNITILCYDKGKFYLEKFDCLPEEV